MAAGSARPRRSSAARCRSSRCSRSPTARSPTSRRCAPRARPSTVWRRWSSRRPVTRRSTCASPTWPATTAPSSSRSGWPRAGRQPRRPRGLVHRARRRARRPRRPRHGGGLRGPPADVAPPLASARVRALRRPSSLVAGRCARFAPQTGRRARDAAAVRRRCAAARRFRAVVHRLAEVGGERRRGCLASRHGRSSGETQCPRGSRGAPARAARGRAGRRSRRLHAVPTTPRTRGSARGASRTPSRGVASVATIPTPGRHAARGRLTLGTAQLAVVALLVLAGLGVAAWWLLGSGGAEVAAPPPRPAADLVSVTASPTPVGCGRHGQRLGDRRRGRQGTPTRHRRARRRVAGGRRARRRRRSTRRGRPHRPQPGPRARRRRADPGRGRAALRRRGDDERRRPRRSPPWSTSTRPTRWRSSRCPTSARSPPRSILAWRTEHGAFTSVDQLLDVDGIGEATLAKLAPYVTL